MQSQVQPPLKAEFVCEGMWNMLCEVQVCAPRDLRQQRNVWEMLYRHDHTWKQVQVPLILHFINNYYYDDDEAPMLLLWVLGY
ncbi:gibberellin-regulated protein 14 [Phtheirospermum japonicum]|uniref:Gibberellin-regulated protein 14 n=1 Tax=Phtheirospermum japonicum TaxID=374723 RepID=A0A830AZC5_9LAMI|nr:gibberellin-regulated protein 14 [Phtheirospermum japonicum]